MITIILIFFLVNFFGTLPYAARIVGVRTKMLAISFTLFNAIALISRTANGFQTPYLAKYIEEHLLIAGNWTPLPFFRCMLLVSTLGCIVGMLFIPTTQRIFTVGVLNYYKKRSLKKLLFESISKRGIICFGNNIKFPAINNLKTLFKFKGLPYKLFIYHAIATVFITVGPIAALYAGFLHPQYRTTASSLAFIINGLAIIIMFLFIDPPLSIMTEDAVQDKIKEPFFRSCIVWFMIARVAGTLIAQLFIIPISKLVALFAISI